MIHGNGLLIHHFHGSYAATVMLGFKTPSDAAYAREVLGRDLWRVVAARRILVWSGNADALACMKLKLAQVGADADKIDSLRTSVDYGEPFEVEIP
jgi:hypothetical protein